MSDIDLTDLYKELKRGGHCLPASSPLMTNCESELSELIKQIDIMFKAKKNVWYKEKSTLELKVETKERENNLQQESLERKNAEIARLREHISHTEKGDKQIISDYQMQVEKLHNDMNLLRKQYEKMRNKHQREKVKLKAEIDSCNIELTSASDKNQKLERDTNNSNLEKKQLQHEVSRLQSQLQSLNEKCDLMEQQATSYQDQLAKRKQMIGDIESALRNELSQLRKQLHEVEDREAERNVEVARLKADVTYWKNKSTKLTQDLQMCEAALKKSNSVANNLRTQHEGLTDELKTQGANLHLAVKSQHNQEKEILKLKELLAEKERTLQAVHNSYNQDEDSKLGQLRSDLDKIEREYRDLRGREDTYRKEIQELKIECDSLQTRMYNTDQECVSLRDELHAKTRELREKEAVVLKYREGQLLEFEQKMANLEAVHEAEVTSLKAELDACREELTQALRKQHQVSYTTTNTGETTFHTSATPTFVSNEEAGTLRLTQIQLDSVRLENKHLKDQILASSQTELELKQAEKYLNEIQRDHETSVEKLKVDNEKLREEMSKLREEMRQALDVHHIKYQKLLRDMQDDLERRETDLQSEHDLARDRERQNHEDQLFTRDAMYNVELSALQAQKQLLIERLETAHEDLENCLDDNHTLTHDNALMSSFAGSVSQALVTSSRTNAADETEFLTLRRGSPDPVRQIAFNKSYQSLSPSKSPRRHDTSSVSRLTSARDSEAEDKWSSGRQTPHSPSGSTSSSNAAERFLENQRQRTQQLEDLFNLHIEDIRSNQQTLAESGNYLNTFKK